MGGLEVLDCDADLVENADLSGVPLLPKEMGTDCFSGLGLRELTLNPDEEPDADEPRSKELCLFARETGVGSGLLMLRVGEDEAEFDGGVDDACDEEVNDDCDDLVEIELGGVFRTEGRVGDEGVGAWSGMGGLGSALGNVCRRKTDGTDGIDSGRALAFGVGVGSGRRESLLDEEEDADPA